jgi:hypothetical protein
MSPNRKISHEAKAVVAVAVLPVTDADQDQRGWKIVGRGLPLQTRRELLGQMVPCYRRASSDEKRRLLDEFTHITGYHRKYAMWMLNHPEEGQQAPVQSRAHRQYGSEVQEALVQVWNAANRICTKRLMPFLSTLVEAMERHGSLHLSEACRD